MLLGSWWHVKCLSALTLLRCICDLGNMMNLLPPMESRQRWQLMAETPEALEDNGEGAEV